MATGKYIKVGGVWKPVTGEYVKIGGAWKPVTANYVKVGGAWKGIPFAKYLFICEQISDRLYGLDDVPANLPGWPHIGIATDPFDVAVDSDGNSYWACADGVYKYSAAGVQQWHYTGHAASVLSVCVDADGFVYSGDFAGVVKQLNPLGAVQWSKTLGAGYAVYALAVDYSAGRLYAGTGWSYDAIYRLVTSNGNSTKIFTSTYGDITSIAIDEGLPDLYVGTNAGHLLKISIAGYVYNLYGWGSPAPICTDTHGVRVGHDGYLYCATGSTGTVNKFNITTGNSVWAYDPGGAGCAMSCTVDQFGNVYGSWYVAGGSTTDNAIRKLNSAGSLVWTWRPYLTAQMFGVAVSPGIKAAGF